MVLRDVIVRTWMENGRELHAAGCKMAQRYVPAHSAALLVLTRRTSRPVAPPMLTQSVRRIPSATASVAYIPRFWVELLTQ